jgi:DNA-binding MarR family transcriptional regulator
MATLTNSLDRLLGYQLRRASAVMMADLARELSDLDMRPAEVTTLLVIADNPQCSQSEVGEALSIKRANMVPIVSRLMERDLVARTRVDGRSHALLVTDAGQLVVAEARARIARHEARFTELLDPAAFESMLASLSAIRGVRDEDADEAAPALRTVATKP